MNPTQHPSNNRVLSAPAGWDHSQAPVHALAITDTVLQGAPCIASFWRPDAAELAALNAGGLVMLHVIGRTMPPVALAVTVPGGPAA